jgi:tubulin epsilon
MQGRFNKLYKRKVYLHHYTEYTDTAIFDEAQSNLTDIVQQYLEINQETAPKEIYRYKPLL